MSLKHKAIYHKKLVVKLDKRVLHKGNNSK